VTVSGIVTAGRICDPIAAVTRVVLVQQIIEASIAAEQALTGAVSADLSLSGAVAADAVLTATVGLTDALVAALGPEDTLTAILRCDGVVIMADISLVRGDSKNIQVNVFESDGTTPVDLTESVVRFAVKDRTSRPNTEATIFKQSYDAAEIDITNPAGGELLIQILSDETMINPARYCWDLDVSRKQGGIVTSAGTLTATAGSDVLAASGVDFPSLRVGQMLEIPAGPNTGLYVLTAIDSDAQTVTVGGASLQAESGISFNVFQSNVKTPVSGDFIVTADVAA
jgi:hypothetical protein